MANVSSSNGLEKRPKLRFPGFDEPWRAERLSDFADRVTRKNSKNETDLPLTISSKDGLVDQVSYFNKTVASKDMSGYYLLKNGEFAYNKSYSVGYDFGSIKRLDRYPMGALSTLYICFALKRHESDFIKSYFDSLKWYREIYMISAEGARNHGLLNVPTEEFFDTKHYLPENTDEQKKIADFLIALDRRIETQQSLVDNLKKYKRGAIQKLFSETDMEQWNLVKLKDVVKVFDGTHQTPNYKTTGVRFISVENILDPLATQKYISEDDYRKEFKVHPEYGDVLMTRIGDIGRTYYVNFDSDMAYYVSLALFKCSPKIEGRFLAAYISTNTFQKELWERTLHIAFPKKINTGEIGECSIRLPSRERQIAIASYLDVIEKKIRLAEKKLDLIQIIKTGLMQQLFI